jgi:hypothetical protein
MMRKIVMGAEIEMMMESTGQVEVECAAQERKHAQGTTDYKTDQIEIRPSHGDTSNPI